VHAGHLGIARAGPATALDLASATRERSLAHPAIQVRTDLSQVRPGRSCEKPILNGLINEYARDA
jgi:hypothetical protein